MIHHPQQFLIEDSGNFPGSKYPVLLYKHALTLPTLLPTTFIKNLFRRNGWTNNWRSGIYTYHHYHSITHEVFAACRGETTLLLGGDEGTFVNFEKGDVIVIPAGVAHKNMGNEDDVICVGGYPEGRDFDMNYGKEGERPQTDMNIKALPVPKTDPVSGKRGGIPEIWAKY